jgi:hypothetical protein
MRLKAFGEQAALVLFTASPIRPERDARLAPTPAQSPLHLIGKWLSVPLAHW